MEKLEKFIREKNIEAAHMLRTPFWLKEIYPEADEAMLIAALCHDIERCFPIRDGEVKPLKTGDDAQDGEYLRWHGQRSAGFAEALLREHGFNDETAIERIKKLISEHSFGGTLEKDMLMDADSLSFFENSALEMVQKYDDRERLKRKLESEYRRLFSQKARELAQPFFNAAFRVLEMK